MRMKVTQRRRLYAPHTPTSITNLPHPARNRHNTTWRLGPARIGGFLTNPLEGRIIGLVENKTGQTEWATRESMSQKTINNWLSLAEYDLNTADAMFQTKRYLYVAFMCQQAIEKLLKAGYVKAHSSTPPYTHNLLRLLKDAPWINEIQNTEMMPVLEELNSYYIESRYTEDIQGLSTILTEKRAEQVLKSTKGLYRWIQGKISSETRS